jgi:integrase
LAFYDTGYRKQTLLLSKWSDLDHQKRILRRPAEEQKDDEDGAQELHPDTIKVIQSIRSPSRIHIWPWPFSAKSNKPWYDRLGRILDRAGLSRLPAKPTHGFRASHATYLSEVAGLQAAADSCNHSSPQVTRDSYIDNTLLSAGRNATKIRRPELPIIGPQKMLEFD